MKRCCGVKEGSSGGYFRDSLLKKQGDEIAGWEMGEEEK